MGSYKQYRKIFKQKSIDNYLVFGDNLNNFLNNVINKNPNSKIEHIIIHKPYHITIIYSVLEEIK